MKPTSLLALLLAAAGWVYTLRHVTRARSWLLRPVLAASAETRF